MTEGNDTYHVLMGALEALQHGEDVGNDIHRVTGFAKTKIEAGLWEALEAHRKCVMLAEALTEVGDIAESAMLGLGDSVEEFAKIATTSDKALDAVGRPNTPNHQIQAT